MEYRNDRPPHNPDDPRGGGGPGGGPGTEAQATWKKWMASAKKASGGKEGEPTSAAHDSIFHT